MWSRDHLQRELPITIRATHRAAALTLRQWVALLRMGMDYTTWRATLESGVGTRMTEIITRQSTDLEIPEGHPLAIILG